MRIAKHFLIVLFCSLIAACSLVKTGYNNTPALTVWWLDDYLSFTLEQQATLKRSLQKLHQWHRQTQLPAYIDLLKSAQLSLARAEISTDEVCANLETIKAKVQTLQFESIPIIIELAPTLSDKQLQHFQRKLAERTQKWKKEWWQENKAEQLNARLEKAEDFSEDMYGDLSDAQLTQLKQSLEQANIQPEITYKEILRRDQNTYETLNTLRDNNLSAEEKQLLLKAGFARLQNSPDAAYQTHADAMTKHTCQTMANLHGSTTEKQKLHVKNWLAGYMNVMTELQTK